MRPPKTFQPVAINLFRCGPPLWSPQHNHGPPRALRYSCLASFLRMLPDFRDALLCRGRHCLVHALGVRTLDKVRRPSVAPEDAFELLVTNAREDCGIIDFVAVEMKNRQDRAIPHRIEEFVDVPGSCKGPGLRFTVSDYRRDYQIRIIECGS